MNVMKTACLRVTREELRVKRTCIKREKIINWQSSYRNWEITWPSNL